MVTVAVVETADGRRKAVLSGCTYATAVAVGDKVGSEGADVTGIAANGVQVRLPDTTSILVKKGLPLPCKATGGTGGGTGAGDTTGGTGEDGAGTTGGTTGGGGEQALTADEMNALKELADWRTSVVSFVTAGYGVPVDVLLVLSVATMPHQPAAVAEAMAKLGWTPAPGIEKTSFDRLHVEEGKITVSGVTPGKAAFDTLLKRLKTSNPLLTRVKVISSGPKPGGFGFELGIEAPLVAASQVAIQGNPSGAKPLPSSLEAKLGKAAARLPRDPTLSGQESELQTMADQSGLTVDSLSRVGDPIAEGYLGMVTYELKASGPAQALITWLAKLRGRGQSNSPVIVDPLTVDATGIRATVRVPYVAGKSDARKPAPPSIFLPNLSSERWSTARSIPVPSLRDPFTR